MFTVCPTGPINLNTDPGLHTTTVTWPNPMATDNCSVTVMQVGGPPRGSTQPVGHYSISYKADDGNGNMVFCNFMVNVIDNQPPVITGCPPVQAVNGTIRRNNATGLCSAVVSWTEPGVSDNCPGATVSRIDGGPANGGAFPVGTTVIMYKATDAVGNMSGICTFNVTVVDAENPRIMCPPDIVAPTDPGVCTAVVTWVVPVGTDNCPGAMTTQIGGPAPGSTFPKGGPVMITYQVVDAAGHVVTCSFTVTVVDREAPVLTGCPGGPNHLITVFTNLPGCKATVTWTPPTATDNCRGFISLFSNHQPGEMFMLGDTQVKYAATDDAMPPNVSACIFTVRVIKSIDIDNNGVVNDLDRVAFIRVLLGLDTDPIHVARSDVNCDGKEDGDDIQPFENLFFP